MSRVRIAVAGAGLIGQRHIEEVDASDSADLAAIVDPAPAAEDIARKYSVRRYATLAELFAADRPDGVILATPNQLHVDGGLECVAAGVPVIVEKPIGDSVESAARLVEAGEAAGVPMLTGHHRNYSPIMAKAREIVRERRDRRRRRRGRAPRCSTSRTTTSTPAAAGGGSRAAGRSCST